MPGSARSSLGSRSAAVLQVGRQGRGGEGRAGRHEGLVSASASKRVHQLGGNGPRPCPVCLLQAAHRSTSSRSLCTAGPSWAGLSSSTSACHASAKSSAQNSTGCCPSAARRSSFRATALRRCCTAVLHASGKVGGSASVFAPWFQPSLQLCQAKSLQPSQGCTWKWQPVAGYPGRRCNLHNKRYMYQSTGVKLTVANSNTRTTARGDGDPFKNPHALHARQPGLLATF